MVLYAALGVLLHRYSGQTDIVIGTPIANRSRVELENMVGFFADTLAIRIDLSDEPTFRELLARVKIACLGAYANPDTPFEQIVATLQPERSMAYSPLFQVMLAHQPGHVVQPELDGLRGETLRVDVRRASFDLTVEVEES